MCCETTERINAIKRGEKEASYSGGCETRGWVLCQQTRDTPTRKWAYDRYKGYAFHDLRNLYCVKYVNEETASTEKIT